MAPLKTSPLLVVLHLLLSLGCTGIAETEHRIKGAKPLQGAAGCQLSLPGPKDSITFHITHGSKQLLLRPWGSFAILPSSRGEPSLFCAHLRCSPTRRPHRAAPMLGLWFWVWVQALHTHCARLESTGCRHERLPRRRDSAAVIPAAPSCHDSWEAERLNCPSKPAPGQQRHHCSAASSAGTSPVSPLLSHRLQLLFLHW